MWVLFTLGAAARVLGRFDPGPSIFFRVDRQADIDTARDQLGIAKFEAAFAEGEEMPSEQSIALALQRITGRFARRMSS